MGKQERSRSRKGRCDLEFNRPPYPYIYHETTTLTPFDKLRRRASLRDQRRCIALAMPSMANDDWDGAAPMHKALKNLATSSRPISASRVKTAASTALDNVKVRPR